MKRSPTRTTNRIHFSDLEPRRFEDLCLNLMFTLRPWSDIRHYGRLGSDEGVDIFARETLENDEERCWFVQCRRYEKASQRTLCQAVDDAIAKTDSVPDVLLVVLGCDVRKNAQDGFDRYAQRKGIAQPILWTASVLEAKLYAERRDLLFSYFGISMASESRGREQTVRRNIELKKRVLRDLIRPAKDRQTPPNAPYNKFASHKAIIRSIDDSSYPRVDDSGPGISSWFRLEFFDLYHNGIEFILRIEYVLIDQNGLWDLVPYDYQPRRRDLSRIKIWHNACIPFRNIVEIDTLGDEYYAEPHIYCRFADGGQPYEEFRYRLCSDMYPSPLAPEDRRPLDELDSASAEQNAPADTQRDACG